MKKILNMHILLLLFTATIYAQSISFTLIESENLQRYQNYRPLTSNNQLPNQFISIKDIGEAKELSAISNFVYESENFTILRFERDIPLREHRSFILIVNSQNQIVCQSNPFPQWYNVQVVEDNSSEAKFIISYFNQGNIVNSFELKQIDNKYMQLFEDSADDLIADYSQTSLSDVDAFLELVLSFQKNNRLPETGYFSIDQFYRSPAVMIPFLPERIFLAQDIDWLSESTQILPVDYVYTVEGIRTLISISDYIREKHPELSMKLPQYSLQLTSYSYNSNDFLFIKGRLNASSYRQLPPHNRDNHTEDFSISIELNSSSIHSFEIGENRSPGPTIENDYRYYIQENDSLPDREDCNDLVGRLVQFIDESSNNDRYSDQFKEELLHLMENLSDYSIQFRNVNFDGIDLIEAQLLPISFANDPYWHDVSVLSEPIEELIGVFSIRFNPDSKRFSAFRLESMNPLREYNIEKLKFISDSGDLTFTSADEIEEILTLFDSYRPVRENISEYPFENLSITIYTENGIKQIEYSGNSGNQFRLDSQLYMIDLSDDHSLRDYLRSHSLSGWESSTKREEEVD